MTPQQLTMNLATDDPITMFFSDGLLIVTLETQQDRHAALDFARMIRGFPAVKSIDTNKDNRTYTVHFRSVASLETLKDGIRELARRHLEFWQNQPSQSSLF